MIKFTLLLAAAVFMMGGLTGCYTARGFGQDLTHLGEKISDDADYHMDN